MLNIIFTKPQDPNIIVITNDNKIKEATPTLGDMLDELAEDYGLTRLPNEGNLTFARRINEKKQCP